MSPSAYTNSPLSKYVANLSEESVTKPRNLNKETYCISRVPSNNHKKSDDYSNIDITSDSLFIVNSPCEIKDFKTRMSIRLDKGEMLHIYSDSSEANSTIIKAFLEDSDELMDLDAMNIRRLVAMGKLRLTNSI